jgi:hypothetical protein
VFVVVYSFRRLLRFHSDHDDCYFDHFDHCHFDYFDCPTITTTLTTLTTATLTTLTARLRAPTPHTGVRCWAILLAVSVKRMCASPWCSEGAGSGAEQTSNTCEEVTPRTSGPAVSEVGATVLRRALHSTSAHRSVLGVVLRTWCHFPVLGWCLSQLLKPWAFVIKFIHLIAGWSDFVSGHS